MLKDVFLASRYGARASSFLCLLIVAMLACVPASAYEAGEGWTGSGGVSGQGSAAAACAAVAATQQTITDLKPRDKQETCPKPSGACCKTYDSADGQTRDCYNYVYLQCGPGRYACNDKCVPFSQRNDAKCLCTQEPTPSCPTDENSKTAAAGTGGAAVSNPVLLPSGTKVEFATDYQTGGSNPLSVSRSYSSGNFYYGQLGNKWRFLWERQLDVVSATELKFVLGNGTTIVTVADSGGVFRPTIYSYANNPDLDVSAVKLTSPVDAYEFTDESDNVDRYELVGSVWRLVSNRNRSGYTRTFSYNSAGLLTTIVDSHGRTLTFTYEASLPSPGLDEDRVVSQVDGPGGIRIKFTYSRSSIGSSVAAYYTTTILTGVEVTSSTITPAPSETTTYHYEVSSNPHLLTGITDARIVRYATFGYDNDERVTLSEHAGATDRTTFAYNDTADTITVTNPLNKQAQFNISAIAGKRRIISIDGIASTSCPASSKASSFDSTGRITQTTDEEGRVTKYVLDSRGQPTTITRGFGTAEAVSTTFTYHSTLRVPTQMVEPGLTTNYTWTSGRLTSLSQVDTTSGSVPYSSNGQTRTTAYAYTGTAGLLSSVDGPLAGSGDTVSYTYDSNGYVATVTNEVGHVTTVNTTNARGQPTQITDANGVLTNLTYDFQGRLLTVTVNPGASQAVTTMTYNAIGQITRITPPDGAYFDYTYNNARRLTTITGLDGQKIEYAYDLMGNRTSETIKDSSNTVRFSQTQTFDELGRLLQNIGANSQTTGYAYEKNDNLKTVTDPRSGVYSYAYDSLNRLIRETDQETSQVNYTLDGRDNVTTYADPRTLQTTYTRNGFGEVKREVSPDRGTTDYVYDLRGLVTQKTDGRGIVTNMTYDNAGRRLTKTFPAASAEDLDYTYDSTVSGNKGIGRLTKINDEPGSIDFKYDVRGNVIREDLNVGGYSNPVTYEFDAADRATKVNYPSGRIVTYYRDTMGRIDKITTKKTSADASVNVATVIAYQPLSRLVKSFTYSNGLTETASYSNDYELSQCQVKNGSTAVLDSSYGRSDSLNLTGITDTVTSSYSQSFGYSSANRLNSASGVYGSQSWAYDGVGNRTSQTLAGVTDSYSYPGTSNQVQSVVRSGVTQRSFTYDGAGNMLSDDRSGTVYVYAYTYNKANRLKTVSEAGTLKATYTYNGREQLATRVVTNSGAANGTTHFVHDQWGNVIAELDSTGATVREYIWLIEAEIAPTRQSRAQVDRPMAVVDGVNTGSPQLYMVHVDHLARPVRLTNSSKASMWDAVYTPWGAPHAITGTVVQNARFPGQWFQLEAGLHYNWHRHYDPSLGRYTQPDPLGFVDGPSVFAYATNEATIGVDFDGLNRFRRSGPGSRSFLTPPGINPGALDYTTPRLPNYSPPARGLPPTGTVPPGLRSDQCHIAPASRLGEASRGGQSLYDHLGGEWRWSPADRYHHPHWDYKPPGGPNQSWQNIPQTPNVPVMRK